MSFEDDKEWCLRQVRERNWDWFLTLRYPKVAGPDHDGPRMNNCNDAFIEWLNEIQQENSFGYVRVTETRDSGETQLHVLLPVIFYERRFYFRRRWFEISAGRTWQREIRPDTERLFRYFVCRLGLPIKCQVRSQYAEWPGRAEEEFWERYRFGR